MPLQVLGALDARLLHRVEAVSCVLPAVELGAGHGLAFVVRDRASDHDAVALVGVDEHRLAPRPMGRARDEERAEHRVLGGPFGGVVVDDLDERRHAEGVGQEDELLTSVVAHLTGAGEEVDALEPLVAGEVHLGHKRMEVLDRRLADLADPGIR